MTIDKTESLTQSVPGTKISILENANRSVTAPFLEQWSKLFASFATITFGTSRKVHGREG